MTDSKVTPLKDWLDNQEVMQALHISRRTLQTLRTNGTLPFSKIGNKIYYRQQDILKILSDNYTMNKIRNYGNK
jgi:DNA-binding transcriptional MerR regulator